MNKNIFRLLTSSLIVSIFGLIGLFIKIQYIRSDNASMIEYFKKVSSIFDSFSSTLNIFISSDSLIIPDIELIDSKGGNKNIRETIEDGKMLIYLPTIPCNSCATEEMRLINTAFGEGVKNVMVVSNFKTIREQKIFEKESNLTAYSLRNDMIFPTKELNQQKAYFLVYKDLLIHCLLLPDGNNTKIVELYYNAMSEKFNHKEKK